MKGVNCRMLILKSELSIVAYIPFYTKHMLFIIDAYFKDFASIMKQNYRSNIPWIIRNFIFFG